VKLARNATGLMTKLFKSESFFAGIRVSLLFLFQNRGKFVVINSGLKVNFRNKAQFVLKFSN
jgi:hypothetical protein